MNNRRLAERTIVYDDFLYARPLRWVIPQDVARVYGSVDHGCLSNVVIDGSEQEKPNGLSVVGYRQNGAYVSIMDAENLPVEFFNHQLGNYDQSDEKDIHAFLSSWGFLYSPSRENRFCLKYFSREEQENDRLGIELTSQLERLVRDRTLYEGHIISLAEARSALRLIQSVVQEIAHEIEDRDHRGRYDDRMAQLMADNAGDARGLFAALDHTQDGVFRIVGVLEAGSSNPVKIMPAEHYLANEMDVLGDGLSNRGLLMSAICNQIVAALNDSAPWRKCACEGCNRIFKRKQSKSDNPDSDSIYCSDKCMERQKKRNQRIAAKNRIQH